MDDTVWPRSIHLFIIIESARPCDCDLLLGWNKRRMELNESYLYQRSNLVGTCSLIFVKDGLWRTVLK